MIPRSLAHRVLGLSKQRVWILFGQGRIATIQIGSFQFVPIAALEAFLAQERKAGHRLTPPIDLADYRQAVGKQQKKISK
jgi:hypothetical protein